MSTSKMANNTSLSNQYLFSEAYLRELFSTPISPDLPAAAQKMIFEWREEYPDLGRKENLLDYLSQCLVSLGFTYTRKSSPDYFLLFADETHAQPLGICLPVANDDIGCMLKGRHYQVKMVKLLKENNLAWGIISNGSAWRLCYANSTTPYEVYLQAQLDDILHPQFLDTFIQYYRFFSRNAFSFHQTTSDNSPQQGLDKLLAESETTTQLIEKHLKNRVDDVLQALCLGFVNDENTHDLQQPDLDEIYHNAIYLLYRMLFLFYAEARHLLPVDEDAYHKHSLEAIVEDVWRWQVDGWRSTDSHGLWTRLANLCGIVDIGDQEAGVNAYNGGLFSDSENPYLRKHQIKNDFLAPAIFYLAFMDTKTGLQPIEYRDLSVRHLGTLYEGMLEYRLNLVREEPVVVRESKGKRVYIKQSIAQPRKGETILQIGQVYFADDKGERKSSGSYYTPEDVVQYIVSQTLLPKLEELAAPLKDIAKQTERDRQIAVNLTERAQVESYADRQALGLVNEKLLRLKILDPAMGSAHFLVAAGQTLTNFIVEQLNTFDWPSETTTDPLVWKRRVVERCLYGVDINPLAQELAKLSLWLNSAAAGKPLTFLDHHLKVGNSLFGATIQKLSILPILKNSDEKVAGMEISVDMLQQAYQSILKNMMAELSQITGYDTERIEDVKGKGVAYQQAYSLSKRLRDIANVWLGTLFGLINSDNKPINESQYFDLVQKAFSSIDQDEWDIFASTNQIIKTAQQLAQENKFFHWELEFPDVVIEDRCRFDIIIANPPYVGTSPTLSITKLYETAKCRDLYAWIMECGLKILENNGNMGTIIPLSVIFAGEKRSLRNLLLQQNGQTNLISCDNTPDSIFGGEGYNRQRVTLVTINRNNEEKQIFSTAHLRWASHERSKLFDNLRFGNITSLCTEDYFPMVDDWRLVEFFTRLRKLNFSLANITTKNESEIYLCVPSVACYFVSAVPVDLNRRNQEIFLFENLNLQKYAFAIINSNIFYWYWRSRSDGFWVSRDQILGMPIPNIENINMSRIVELSDKLWQGAQIENSKKMGDKQTKNYYFNKRMDILLAIDEWIVEQVAPDLKLPKDIFAQYKSNSFLRPLDLSAVMQESEAEEI